MLSVACKVTFFRHDGCKCSYKFSVTRYSVSSIFLTSCFMNVMNWKGFGIKSVRYVGFPPLENVISLENELYFLHSPISLFFIVFVVNISSHSSQCCRFNHRSGSWSSFVWMYGWVILVLCYLCSCSILYQTSHVRSAWSYCSRNSIEVVQVACVVQPIRE